MGDTLRLDLPVVLPDVGDARDACVERLEASLMAESGVERVHVDDVVGNAAVLCLHYDPERLSLAEVQRLATRAGAAITARYGHAVVALRVVDGEDAARRIEGAVHALPGVIAAVVNIAAQLLRVEFDREQTTLEAVQGGVEAMGYQPGVVLAPAGVLGGRAATIPTPGWYRRNRELVWSLIAGALLIAAWTIDRSGGWITGSVLVLYLLSYGFGAFDLVRHAFSTWRNGRFAFDIDLLMLLAAIGAAILGEWAEGAFLLFLFSLAHSLEHDAMGRARNAIKALAELAPTTANVLRDGSTAVVPIEEVTTGDIVVVKPADRIPVDGIVRSGRSGVDQAPITGESVPVDKEPGAEVFAGTVNGEGALEIEVTRVAGDRTLDRVVKLVEEAQTQKAPTQLFTDRFERIFVPAVLIADLLLIVVPPLLGWWTWDVSFYRGMALLVAASPCALALGTPAAVLAGIAQAARNGVLIKGGAHLENLGELRAMALDKTGTLTQGKPEVTDIVPAGGVAESELLAVAASVERQSQHPLALAVVRRAEEQQLALPEAGELTSFTARGVRSSVGGETVEIGSLRLWEELNVEIPEEIRAATAELQGRGRSTMAVKHGERWLGVLGIADQPREGVRAVLDALRSLGIRPLIMLTGDNKGVGDAIGKEVGVDEVRADLLPEDKVTSIKALLAEHGQVAMLGDGVNDAPALAHATVGIAMGGAGTAVALETADVALMGDDLARLPYAVALSRQARRIIRQNLYLSLGIIAVLVVATVTGVSGIGFAVLIHEGSTLVVIGNALRLLAYRSA